MAATPCFKLHASGLLLLLGLCLLLICHSEGNAQQSLWSLCCHQWEAA